MEILWTSILTFRTATTSKSTSTRLDLMERNFLRDEHGLINVVEPYKGPATRQGPLSAFDELWTDNIHARGTNEYEYKYNGLLISEKVPWNGTSSHPIHNLILHTTDPISINRNSDPKTHAPFPLSHTLGGVAIHLPYTVVSVPYRYCLSLMAVSVTQWYCLSLMAVSVTQWYCLSLIAVPCASMASLKGTSYSSVAGHRFVSSPDDRLWVGFAL